MVFKLEHFIDMHIHSEPDVRERSHNDFELASMLEENGGDAIVIKSHQFPTVDRAWYLQKLYPKIKVFGSVTCNFSIGGLNDIAVSYALLLGAKVVWLPTIDAKNHRLNEGKTGGISLLENGELTVEAKRILDLVVKHNITLGTGHISKEEIEKVATYLSNYDYKKLVITHPEFHIISLSIEEQISLVDRYDLFFERTYAQPIGNGEYKVNLEQNLKAIKEVGFETTIISTDSGQVENPPWNVSLPKYYDYMLEHGISEKALKSMAYEIPKKLLDI